MGVVYKKDDLISREVARRIIDSPRSKQQMLLILSTVPSVQPENTKCEDCKYRYDGICNHPKMEDWVECYGLSGAGFCPDLDFSCSLAERREL